VMNTTGLPGSIAQTLPTGRETQGRLHSGCLSQTCWLQPHMHIGWDIRYGIARPPRIRLTQTMVTVDTDDTTFGKLLRRGDMGDSAT
jgi:hypothetical protein